jgi:hypothetical protein
VTCASTVSNVLGGINGYFGGVKAGRSKVTTTVEGHSGSDPCTKWFAFSGASHTDRQSKAGQSQANDVCSRQGEDFEVDERALGEVQSRKSEEGKVARL